ncbi:MAG: beta-ketoacyl synthase N-terminal-like domain-containing protein [Burkholderiaceae bacterium]
MSAVPVSFRGFGLVTSVGLDAPSTCAAIRAKLQNPVETRVIDSRGEWLFGHEVPLGELHRGRAKLVRMCAMAIGECLEKLPPRERAGIPLLLCVAERSRPGRLPGLEDELFLEIESALGITFADQSVVVPQGRLGFASAVDVARQMMLEGTARRVMVAAVDTLMNVATMTAYERAGRLLTAANSNGFLPGEGAGAVLLEQDASAPALVCSGLGFATERAHIESGEPLRADGLSRAIRAALDDAGMRYPALDFRVTDLSGEHYYFKEAALAMSRSLRERKQEMDLWHPAECVGETGAVGGLLAAAVADAACRKGYAPGRSILAHAGNDDGRRAAMVLRYLGESSPRH